MVASESGGKGIPVGFFLLPNKKAATYEFLLEKIKERLGGQPDCLETIISDFEKAVFSSVRKVFAGVDHKGCRFHKYAAIWKQLGDKGLQGLFYQSASFKEVVYKLFALCYVPTVDVITVYQEQILPTIETLASEDEVWMEYTDELEEFGYYYETTWIQRRNGRLPLFAPCLWNHFDTLLADGVQTNNLLESFNRTFNKLAGTSPNVWKIHELFRSTEADTRRSFMSNALGKDKSTNSGRKQKFLDGLGRLKFVAESYDTIPNSDYIRMIAHELAKQDDDS